MTTSGSLMERKNAAISHGVSMATQIFASRAENSEIWDKEGVIYADVQPAQTIALRHENPGWRGQRGDLYHYSRRPG